MSMNDIFLFYDYFTFMKKTGGLFFFFRTLQNLLLREKWFSCRALVMKSKFDRREESTDYGLFSYPLLFRLHIFETEDQKFDNF